MEEIKILSNSIVKDGVQAIVMVEKAFNFLDQKYILVQDCNDRGRGDGNKMYGLPGGAIEKKEIPEGSILRELYEEIAFNSSGNYTFEKFGCYQKLRPNGQINDNHLFVLRLNSCPVLRTNDQKEVSMVHLLTLKEIINLAIKKQVHEGSIRLILKFLKEERFGSLNELVIFDSVSF
jgi:ADP-ribose pyrophosphatase YjhB (NUDIX family)